MTVKADQERVKTLLKDTITLLCKNGLSFKSKFSIEAVIGVTLDEDDVFLVSMNEIVQSEVQTAAVAAIDNAKHSPGRDSNHRRKRRKRQFVKIEDGEADVSEGQELSSDEDIPSGSGGIGSPKSYSNQAQLSFEPSPAKKRHSSQTPDESQDADNSREYEEDSREENDLIFIKQEMDETWAGQDGTQPQLHEQLQDISAITEASALAGMSEQDFAAVQGQVQPFAQASWMPDMTPPMFKTRRGRTGPVDEMASQLQEGESQELSHEQQQMYLMYAADVSQSKKEKPAYICDICGKRCSSKPDLTGHLSWHTGQKEFPCSVCGKDFRYKKGLTRHMKQSHPSYYTCQNI